MPGAGFPLQVLLAVDLGRATARGSGDHGGLRPCHGDDGGGGAGLPPPATGSLVSFLSKQSDQLSLSSEVPLAGSYSCAVLKNALYTSVLGTMQSTPCISQLGEPGSQDGVCGLWYHQDSSPFPARRGQALRTSLLLCIQHWLMGEYTASFRRTQCKTVQL